MAKLAALRADPADPNARCDALIDTFKISEAESVAPLVARNEPARPVANPASRRRPPRPPGPGRPPQSGGDPRRPPPPTA